MNNFREQDGQSLVTNLQEICDLLNHGPSPDATAETWQKALAQRANTVRIQCVEMVRSLEAWKAGNLKLLSEKRSLSNEVQKLKDEIERMNTLRAAPISQLSRSISSSFVVDQHAPFAPVDRDPVIDDETKTEINSICALVGASEVRTVVTEMSHVSSPMETPMSSHSRTGLWVKNSTNARSYDSAQLGHGYSPCAHPIASDLRSVASTSVTSRRTHVRRARVPRKSGVSYQHQAICILRRAVDRTSLVTLQLTNFLSMASSSLLKNSRSWWNQLPFEWLLNYSHQVTFAHGFVIGCAVVHSFGSFWDTPTLLELDSGHLSAVPNSPTLMLDLTNDAGSFIVDSSSSSSLRGSREVETANDKSK